MENQRGFPSRELISARHALKLQISNLCSHVGYELVRLAKLLAPLLFFNWSRVARVTRFRGYAVSKSTGVNQTSPLDRHHPTQTLETMRFGVSNAPGGLLGPEISQVGGRPSWPSGVPGEAASGRAAHARSCQQQAHASCMHHGW